MYIFRGCQRLVGKIGILSYADPDGKIIHERTEIPPITVRQLIEISAIIGSRSLDEIKNEDSVRILREVIPETNEFDVLGDISTEDFEKLVKATLLAIQQTYDAPLPPDLIPEDGSLRPVKLPDAPDIMYAISELTHWYSLSLENVLDMKIQYFFEYLKWLPVLRAESLRDMVAASMFPHYEKDRDRKRVIEEINRALEVLEVWHEKKQTNLRSFLSNRAKFYSDKKKE